MRIPDLHLRVYILFITIFVCDKADNHIEMLLTTYNVKAFIADHENFHRCLILTVLFVEKCILTWRGDIGLCGIVVLKNFSCGISVILISKSGTAIFFSEPTGCFFFFSILGLKEK